MKEQELKNFIKEYLKENIELEVSSPSYIHHDIMRVSLVLEGETLAELDIWPQDIPKENSF